MQRLMKRIAAVAILTAALPAAQADVLLPGHLSDNMVVQRNVAVEIRGRAAAGERVAVSFLGQSVQDTAAADGIWSVKIEPLTEGCGEMTITGANTLTLRNVAVGDVWLWAGGFNVQTALNSKRRDSTAAYCVDANLPAVRFLIPRPMIAAREVNDCGGRWLVAESNSPVISAAAFFFAQELHKAKGVPIGIVQLGWSGPSLESWISRPTLDTQKDLEPSLAAADRQVDEYAQSYYQRNAESVRGWLAACEKARTTSQPAPIFPVPPMTLDDDPRSPDLKAGWCRMPAFVHNGYVAPVAQWPLAGAVLWFHEEPKKERYQKLLPLLVQDLRRSWASPRLPVVLIQSPNMKSPDLEGPASIVEAGGEFMFPDRADIARRAAEAAKGVTDAKR